MGFNSKQIEEEDNDLKLEEKKQALKSEISYLGSKFEELEYLIKDNESKFKELENYEPLIFEKKKQLSHLEQIIKDLTPEKGTLETLNRRIASLLEEEKEIQNRINILQSTIFVLQEEIQKFRDVHISDEKEAKSKIVKIQKDIDAISLIKQKSIQNLQNFIDSIK